jgi:K+-transporting ATPase c subunit
MSNMIRPAISLLVLMTLITGVAYPLVVTGCRPGGLSRPGQWQPGA